MFPVLIPRFTTKKNGGNAYEDTIFELLKKEHTFIPIRLFNSTSVPSTFLSLFIRFFQLKFSKSKVVLLDQSTVFFHSWITNNTILIVHHIDWSQSRPIPALIQWLSFKIMVKQRNKWKKIIVVSEYWKDFLEERGFCNIEIIYNSIDPKIKNLPLLSKLEFTEKYKLPSSNLIYLGNAQKGKGWREVYNQLKTSNFCFIISGQSDDSMLDLPPKVKYLDLPYLDFLAMLKHSSVSVLFSKFQEGWNRTAHESILMGTPVIGSRSGGMTELLDRSGQLVCNDIKDLNSHLDLAMINREELALAGYHYLSKLDESYFKNAWINVFNSFK